MNRPIAADDIVAGKYLLVSKRKPRYFTPPIPYNGDTITRAEIPEPHDCPFDPTGVPMLVQAVSLPFIVGRPLSNLGVICTIDLTLYEVREPNADYVAVFQSYSENKQIIPLFKPKTPPVPKEKKMPRESGKSRKSQASDIGSQGGKKGGPARAAKMTAQERSEVAKKGGEAKKRKGS